MNALFQFTPQATEDLDAIWWFIAEDIAAYEARRVGSVDTLQVDLDAGAGDSAQLRSGTNSNRKRSLQSLKGRFDLVQARCV
jgi:plasmid stabilization system protein ParE